MLLVLCMQPRQRAVVVRCLGPREVVLDPAQLAVTVEAVVDGGARRSRRLLRDVRHAQARLHFDLAGLGRELAAQQGQQAALAGAVRPGDTDLLARHQGEVDAVQQALVAALEDDVAEGDHGEGLNRRGAEAPINAEKGH